MRTLEAALPGNVGAAPRAGAPGGGVHSPVGPRASLPQLSPAWAEAVARAELWCGLAAPAPLRARFAAGRPEGVGSFDLGPGKALNLLIVVV